MVSGWDLLSGAGCALGGVPVYPGEFPYSGGERSFP
jgi:hypothetical protein